MSMFPDRPQPVLIAGVGNPDRGDDGFGPAVASRLAGLSLPGVEATPCRRPIDLLDLWQGRGLVFVADAALAQGAPGRLHRLDALRDRLPPTSSSSTHSFGLAQAIELGRSLGLLPSRLILYAAEARSFAPGAPLSPPMRSAVEAAVRRIARECGGAVETDPSASHRFAGRSPSASPGILP